MATNDENNEIIDLETSDSDTPPTAGGKLESEDVSSELACSESVPVQTPPDTQPNTANVVCSGPLNSTQASNEMFNSKPAQAEHSLIVESEQVEPEPMDLGEANLKNMDEHADSPSTREQHESTELAHPDPHGEAVEYLPPGSSKHMHSQPITSEKLAHPDPLSSLDSDLTEPVNPEHVHLPQPNKHQMKSRIWEHFTIESVGPGCRRAYCNVCFQSFAYCTGSRYAGTSHLKRHIEKGNCSSSPYLILDQDRCRQQIARMIIMHDYPLHMVEHPGFVLFVKNLQPRFDMVSFNIVQGDCVAIFLREKKNLQRFIAGIPGKICLSVDLWTSSQSTAYVFITGQFIDSDWKLHRRLLNVVMELFPESDRALSHAIGTSLSDWGLDRKLASITLNQALSENALDQLRALLALKNPMLLDGQLLIQSCITRTLSSMAQEVIAASEKTIEKVRTTVKYVKTSHKKKFSELKQLLQVPTEKSVSLDNIAKWNTTYEMLLAASELKQVLSCFDAFDLDYNDAPSKEDWREVENILMYLKLLYDTANLLMSEPTPSSNVFFHEVWKIQQELARAAASDDVFVANLAKPLQDKFYKYWKNSGVVLAVAVAMDPRFKMKLVEFSFTEIFMDEAPVYIRAVDEGLHELFQEYVTVPLENNGLSEFDKYIVERCSQQMKSELDQYLEESLLPRARVQDFDVLGWWKLHKLKYPTLSKMARDILSVPLSTVSPDAVFAIPLNEMDSYRCSLRPETLEALICAKDWLKADSNIVSKHDS